MGNVTFMRIVPWLLMSTKSLKKDKVKVTFMIYLYHKEKKKLFCYIEYNYITFVDLSSVINIDVEHKIS